MRRVVWPIAGLVTVGLAGPSWAEPVGEPDGQYLQVAAAARPLVSGERVRVQKLARDMESAMHTLDQGGVAPFQDPAFVQKWQNTVERYRSSLQRYPQVDDPDVQAAAAKLVELENMVAFGIRQPGQQKAELGDVQSILASIEASLRSHPAPQWLPAPFDDAEAKAWLTREADAQQAAKAAVAELQRIAPTAYLPLNPGTVQSGAPYDKQDLNRLMHFANDILSDVNEALTTTQNNLESQAEAQTGELEYYRALDPDNEKDRMTAFLQEGAEAEIYGALDRQLAFANSVAAYQRAFGKTPSAATQARIEDIVAIRKAYAENRQKAVGDSKLPEPKSSDSGRVAIAGRILSKPSYQFGRHGPIVLTTSDIVQREQEVSRARIKDVDVSLSGDITLSGTETTWKYKWKEFKFATPLLDQDSGDWYIWWITAKNFSSGSAQTPIGEWVSGAAVKGSLILEENF